MSKTMVFGSSTTKENTDLILWFQDLSKDDVTQVGGKNASLGEMIQNLKSEDIRVPNGFSTTAEGFWSFIDFNNLRKPMTQILNDLNNDHITLQEGGLKLRGLIKQGSFPPELRKAVIDAYRALSQEGDGLLDVAVRSSATAEDLPEASFAGQQESFLNIRGEEALLEAVRNCFSSLYTDRALTYRNEMGFDHMHVALAVGVQKMVRSDLGCAGVMFTLDTETGFPNVVIVNGAWGLGENVVQGTVRPDEFMVFKPLLEDNTLTPILKKRLGRKEQKMIYAECAERPTKNITTTDEERCCFTLSSNEILNLARWGCLIEKHYGCPMDIEWAKDGITNEMFIVQARPETVQVHRTSGVLHTFTLKEKKTPLLKGLAIGEALAAGSVQIIHTPEQITQFEKGNILVTHNTDPDWVPIMKKAAGIITDLGGRTSHAAIVSRELGIPVVVGTGNATEALVDQQNITLSCVEGETGFIYDGILDFEVDKLDFRSLPQTRTPIMLNLANPAAAFHWWQLPVQGIGLARMEFIINNHIGIHPMALVHPERVSDPDVLETIKSKSKGHADPASYFVASLAEGIGQIAATRWPDPVIVRLSDFKTNEYENLIGGSFFEEEELNPMIGFRGASRYDHLKYQHGFALECQALKKVRQEMGLSNVIIMVPFCRTLEEADRVLDEMKKNKLERGQEGLKVYVMAEIPSNIILAADFAERFDGFSIGTNDLTQLVLGVDRDSMDLAHLFDARNEAVKQMIRMLIKTAHEKNKPVGICGQAPSDYPEFAEFLVEEGIDSLSLNPDSVAEVMRRISKLEKKLISAT